MKTMAQLTDEDREFGAAWDQLYAAASTRIPFSERMAILRAMATKIARVNDHINWRPIDTAPKDGTAVLLVSVTQGRPFLDCGWLDEDLGWQWSFSLEPTHWAPLSLPGDEE